MHEDETPAGHSGRVGCIFPNDHDLSGNSLMDKCMCLNDLSRVAASAHPNPVNMFNFNGDEDDAVEMEQAYLINNRYTEQQFEGIFPAGRSDRRCNVWGTPLRRIDMSRHVR